MGLEKEPPAAFQIQEYVYSRAVQQVKDGETRFIYAFQTPDGKIAYRMTSGQIVEAVEKGQMEVV